MLAETQRNLKSFCLGKLTTYSVDGMKILHLETGMHLYGGAQQVIYLTRGLHERGLDTVLVCPIGSAIAEACEWPHEVITLQMSGDMDLGFPWRFYQAIKQHRPDIVHIHSRRGADTFGGLAASWADVPAVLSRRVDNPESRVSIRLKYRFFRKVIAISNCIRDGLVTAGLDPQRVVCVPSAVDDTVFGRQPCDSPWFRTEFHVSPGQPVLATISQLIPRKGHDTLLKAMVMVRESFRDVRLLLFGRGPLEQTIRARIEELGLTEAVTLEGFRSDIPRILHCVDLLVHPAVKEGLGVALLQAASSGVPVVASRAGGIPEVVEDGVTGLLVPPGDAPTLAEAIIAVLSDHGRARSFGNNAATRAKALFSIDRMVEGNFEVYKNVVAESARGAA